MAVFKSTFNYMKKISLKNLRKKIINDSITLFLFNILKLLCPNILNLLSYFPT